MALPDDRAGTSGQYACPYCSQPAALLVRSTDYNRGTSTQVFDYLQCQSCGLVAMRDIPEDMRPYYAGGYAKIPETLAELRKIAATEKYRLEPVLRSRKAGSLLEIGPWRGVFCCNAKDAGFSVSAIEMDVQCVEFLRNTVGIEAVQSIDPAATLNSMSRQFDVIALWHSLEHLKQPWRVVESAARRLAPGGILLLALPNIESHEFAMLRERWRHLDAPRHLHFYPVRALNALCMACGLEVVEVSTHDYLSQLLATDTWFEWSKRWVGHGFYTRYLTRALRLCASLGDCSENSGSGITAVYRKPGA